MRDWQPLRIKDLGRVVTGKTPPTENAEYFDGDELFVSPKDLTQNSYYVESTATRISEKALEKFRGQVIPRDAVMFTSLSFAFGKMGIASRTCITNQQINSVVVNDKHSARFVYYLLRAYEPYIFAYNSGIDTPIVPKSVFEKIPVVVPARVMQKKIAALLSAYDELIANNQRRIALLESMAEEIYREWFVRMRFPGADRSKFRKGLPAGWSRKSLRQVADIDPFEARRPGEAAPFVPMDRLSTLSMCFDAEETRSDWAGAKFRNHDVLLPRITPSLENGKRGYVFCLEDDEVAVGSTEFIVLRAKLIAPEHLYFVSISDGFRKHAELSMSGASGRQRVQDDCFSFFLIAVPPPEITKAFVEVSRPFFKQIFNMARQTKRLAAMRDALLPRLISGKLRVDQLDIQYTKSMKTELEQAA